MVEHSGKTQLTSRLLYFVKRSVASEMASLIFRSDVWFLSASTSITSFSSSEIQITVFRLRLVLVMRPLRRGCFLCASRSFRSFFSRSNAAWYLRSSGVSVESSAVKSTTVTVDTWLGFKQKQGTFWYLAASTVAALRNFLWSNAIG